MDPFERRQIFTDLTVRNIGTDLIVIILLYSRALCNDAEGVTRRLCNYVHSKVEGVNANVLIHDARALPQGSPASTRN